MSEREHRLALNEALFREMNERVQEQAEALDASFIEAYCECPDLDCVARISITAEEYGAVRADPAQFLIQPGHEISDLEESSLAPTASRSSASVATPRQSRTCSSRGSTATRVCRGDEPGTPRPISRA